MIKPLLKKLGLEENEISVYEVVIKHGKSTPALIARLTKINRPTVYNVCKKLVARGLLVEDLGDKTLKLVPTSPSELNHVLKKDQDELAEKTKLVDELSNELSLLKSSVQYPVPKVRFIEHDRLGQYLYSQTPVWNESATHYDNFLWGFQDTTFVDHYHEWIEWYWNTSDKRHEAFLLSNNAPIELKMAEKQMLNRHIKPWDKGVHFSATTWVFGDYLVMIITDKEPFYLVEIHDKRMAENYRELFKNIWGLI